MLESGSAITTGRVPSRIVPDGAVQPLAAIAHPRPRLLAAAERLRILVADDHPFVQSMLVRFLERQGHDVHIAGNGNVAWEMMKKDHFPVLICGREMPGMDGLALCRRLRAENGNKDYTYVILLTGRARREDYLEALKAGADDFLVKPVETGVLSARLRAAGRVIGLQRDLSERNRLLMSANERIGIAYNHLRADLTAAARLQAQLLPPSQDFPGGLSCRALLLPSSVVSGDVVNCFVLPGRDRIAFYALDVAGHGVRAALSSFVLAKHLRPEKFWAGDETEPDLTSLLRDLNREFQSPDIADYFTIAVGLVDCKRCELTLALAGHPQPLLQLPGAAPVVCGEPGIPVGMLAEPDYTQTMYPFPPGARLLLYSDGVTECSDPDGSLFGQDRLRQLLQSTGSAESPDALMRRIENDLRRWRGEESFADDVSILALSASVR